MIQNQNLNNSIQQTVKAVFDYFNENIVMDPSYADDSLYFFITLHKHEDKIEQIPEFVESVKLMREDKTIVSQENHLIGTMTSMSNIGSLNNCLHVFLRKLYGEMKTYSHEETETEYLNFESFFYSSILLKKDTTRLYNFDCSENEIDFGNGVRIIKSIEAEPNSRHQSMMTPMAYTSFSKSNFIIERIYETKKIVNSGSSADDFQNLAIEELPSSGEIFDFVVKSLRILKSSGVYRDHKIQSEVISFTIGVGTIITSPFFENTVMGEKCEITNSEIPELVSLFQFVKNEKDSRFGVASRRLTSGIERKNIEDKLIDYMIGLETLYLPDADLELKFRLSLRIAFLLTSDNSERKDIFSFIKAMYDKRSNIVHGSNFNLTNEEILRTESFLRISVKLWIKDKSNFLSKISIAGRKAEDGKLNTIFFE